MDEISNKIETSSKNTIGYKEAENKDSFMVGVSVGSSQAIKIYEEKVKQLEQLADMYKKMYENINGDIKTLTALICKYSPL